MLWLITKRLEWAKMRKAAAISFHEPISLQLPLSDAHNLLLTWNCQAGRLLLFFGSTRRLRVNYPKFPCSRPAISRFQRQADICQQNLCTHTSPSLKITLDPFSYIPITPVQELR
jgi:hypothetical protein